MNGDRPSEMKEYRYDLLYWFLPYYAENVLGCIILESVDPRWNS